MTTIAKQSCAAANSGCHVVGSPDSFADVLRADGRPGRVISADESKGYQEVHFVSNEHVLQLLGPDSSHSDRKVAKLIRQKAKDGTCGEYSVYLTALVPLVRISFPGLH